jgi:acetoacetate decarboxylase/3-phenylpropionate/cinnamic acid dioxygenase small subunit
MDAKLLTRGALTCLLVTGLAAPAWAQADKFVPHQNVPGPARLEMEKADNSGAVHADIQFIADRQAIVNHVTAYAYLIDEGRWEDWFALFADDIVFENSTPELGTVITKGKKPFMALVDERYIQPGKTSKAVRRHTMGNVHVAAQTATTAKVRTYMLISNVPAADKLSILTTGTYNATLEKRNDKWTITRWYIEADAPLSPSKLPEGFPEAEVKWIPDPSTVLPGAVSGPTKGLVSLKNMEAAFSMPQSGPLYKAAPEWFWKDIDVVVVDYLTDAKSAAAFLPESMTTLPIPPALHNGQVSLYNPLIYVDRDSAMSGGREIGGWPKKIGDIRMERSGSGYHLSFSRNGQHLVSAAMQVGSKLFSTPLPANTAVRLPYPYNLTFPLPAPTAQPQATVPLPTTTFKLIPGVGGNNPPPALAQLIWAPWQLKGDFFGGSGASVEYQPSADDPLYKLPVLKVLGAMYMSGDMTLALKDMKVAQDLLKQ